MIVSSFVETRHALSLRGSNDHSEQPRTTNKLQTISRLPLDEGVGELFQQFFLRVVDRNAGEAFKAACEVLGDFALYEGRDVE